MTPAADDDTPRAIEAGLERDRSALASTIDELTHRASIDYIAREALGLIKMNTGDATRSAERALRDNPMAFGLMGLGLAWLLLGGKGGKTNGATHALHADDPDPDWHRDIGTLRTRAVEMLHRIEEEARSSLDSLKDQARDFAAERAQVVDDFTAEFRRNLSSGLDHLAESARDQIIAARQQTYAAYLRAERVVKGGTDEVISLVDEHPVAAGAAALAVGAVIGLAVIKAGQQDRTEGHAKWTRGTWTKHDPAARAGGMQRPDVVSTGGAGSVSGTRMGNPSGPFGGTAPTGGFPPS